MRFTILFFCAAALLALPTVAAAQETGSPLRINWKTNEVECSITNDRPTAQTTTLNLHDQTGAIRGTTTGTVNPNGILRLSVNAYTIGWGTSVFCRATNNIGEIAICLWNGVTDPYLCLSDD